MADLISLDCFKDYKKIKSTERDGKLQTLITQVSELIQNYCNRRFMDYSTTPKVEHFDAKVNKVYLTEFPIISVSSVNVSEDGGLNQTALTEAASDKSGYYVDTQEGAIITQNENYNFLDTYETPFRSLEVTYTAGYTQDSLPEDLKLATQDLVAYYEDNERHPTQSLAGATNDNPLPYVANSFPPHIRRILDLYRYSPS